MHFIENRIDRHKVEKPDGLPFLPGEQVEAVGETVLFRAHVIRHRARMKDLGMKQDFPDRRIVFGRADRHHMLYLPEIEQVMVPAGKVGAPLMAKCSFASLRTSATALMTGCPTRFM